MTSLALFDFDGTITTRETMPEFVRATASSGRILLGTFLLPPLLAAHKFDLISSNTIRSSNMRIFYSGVPVRRLIEAGRDFSSNQIPNTLRTDALDRIEWHRSSGHKIVVVSGSLDFYLSPWCQEHGLDLICSTLDHRNGVLTGGYLGKPCVKSEKANRIRANYQLDKFSEIYAYGDSSEDLHMLELASKKYYREF